MNKRTTFIFFTLALCLVSMSLQAESVLINKLRDFTAGGADGYWPADIQMGPDNAIYGVTADGGSGTGGIIFKINTDGSGYQILHGFSRAETGGGVPSTNSNPIGVSIVPSRDGFIYGTTWTGTNGFGMVFRCNSDGNVFTVLHNFSSSDGNPLSLMQGQDGLLYGTGVQTVFALDTLGNNYRVLHSFSPAEGFTAPGRLVQGNDGALYGTIAHDDTDHPAGTAFKVTTNGSFTVLHTFPAFSGDGIDPVAGLIQGSDGALYGATLFGGTNSMGTVFKINTDGNGYQVLYSFSAGNLGVSDGNNPYGELVEGPGGILYGTTMYGVNNDTDGTIFKINKDGSGYNVLYSFTGKTNGTIPSAALLRGPAADGTPWFYGTARLGGSGSEGTLFSLLVNPPVSIAPLATQTVGGQTVVYWPAWAYNYVLQTTSNLSSPDWQTVSNVAPVSAVVVTNSGSSGYFRLVHP